VCKGFYPLLSVLLRFTSLDFNYEGKRQGGKGGKGAFMQKTLNLLISGFTWLHFALCEAF
jgi:hypothetical protein